MQKRVDVAAVLARGGRPPSRSRSSRSDARRTGRGRRGASRRLTRALIDDPPPSLRFSTAQKRLPAAASTEPTWRIRFLPAFLLLEQLALAGDVSPVALCESTSLRLALTVSASDNDASPIAAWTGTSNIWRGIFSRSFSTSAFPRDAVRLVAVDDQAQRVDGVAAEENVELARDRPSRKPIMS